MNSLNSLLFAKQHRNSWFYSRAGVFRRIVLMIMLLPVAMLQFACQDPATSEKTSGATDTVIYTASRIQTMDSQTPVAEAVAVRGNQIAGVGSVADLQGEFPDAFVDDRFNHHTLVPGLIDPHMHVLLASMMYGLPFATPWPMAMPDGEASGYPERVQFLDRLRDIVRTAPDNDMPVIVYGYHNLIQGDLNRFDLDDISPQRPLIVWHYSGHDFYLNSSALELAGISTDLHQQFEGIDLDDSGELSGRIFEDALPYLLKRIGIYLFNPTVVQRGANRYFQIIKNAGVTTTAEMAWGVIDRRLENAIIASNWSLEDDGLRLYLIPEYRAFNHEFGDTAPAIIGQMAAGEADTPAPVLPRVKYFTDAAFYSQTMRVSPPGYMSGQSQGSEGMWVLQPDEIADTILPFWQAGLAVHIHSNGDAAQTATLDALRTLRNSNPSLGFVIEHGGLFSPQQVAQAAELDAMVSAASHYVYFMAGFYKEPLGPQRSQWILPLGSLSRAGVPVTVHSDAPLAPPQPLRGAGVHITRATREGVPYEPDQALTRLAALEAITLNAARVLGLDDEIGSIEAGKKADFTVLYDDPLDTPGEDWASIKIWGTVVDGRIHKLTDK